MCRSSELGLRHECPGPKSEACIMSLVTRFVLFSTLVAAGLAPLQLGRRLRAHIRGKLRRPNMRMPKLENHRPHGPIALALGPISEFERRPLISGYEPMDYAVLSLDESHAGEIGIEKREIEFRIESQLREAHLYDPSARQVLFLHVSLGPDSMYLVSLVLSRKINDMGYGIPGLVDVWRDATFGNHHGAGKEVLDVITEHLGGFLIKYVRANDSSQTSRYSYNA